VQARARSEGQVCRRYRGPGGCYKRRDREEALRLIDVEYAVLPAVFDMEEALKPGAPQLYGEFPATW